MTFKKLFTSPVRERIAKVLPTLFNIVELENRRGKKLSMEVGTARERVIIALFMYAYTPESIVLPPPTLPNYDVLVNNRPVSIKTRTGSGYSGVKLVWTVDWSKVSQFAKTYSPSSDMLFVNINWGTDNGGFFLFPLKVQQEVFRQFGKMYIKLPTKGTNPRGVELSAHAMHQLQEHKDTLSLKIHWQRDKNLLVEQALYGRWIELWENL